jgi:hypothetical protein
MELLVGVINLCIRHQSGYLRVLSGTLRKSGSVEKRSVKRTCHGGKVNVVDDVMIGHGGGRGLSFFVLPTLNVLLFDLLVCTCTPLLRD